MNARQRTRRRTPVAQASAGLGAVGLEEHGERLEQVPALVDEQEVEAIRWAGYKTAMADADAYLDRGLDAALERMRKVIDGARLDYYRSIDAAFAAHAAARRAAMNAHELAQATP